MKDTDTDTLEITPAHILDVIHQLLSEHTQELDIPKSILMDGAQTMPVPSHPNQLHLDVSPAHRFVITVTPITPISSTHLSPEALATFLRSVEDHSRLCITIETLDPTVYGFESLIKYHTDCSGILAHIWSFGSSYRVTRSDMSTQIMPPECTPTFRTLEEAHLQAMKYFRYMLTRIS